MKYVFLSILALVTFQGLFAQASGANDIDQWLFEQPADNNRVTKQDTIVTNDLITVNYNKKDAKLAMLMSMIIPGAGQYYADKSSITTYIFPALELAFLGGLIYYDQQGDKKTKAFEKYANGEMIPYKHFDGTPVLDNQGNQVYGTRYNRQYQSAVQTIMIDILPNSQSQVVDIYEPSYFRLDNSNTQHFYEDIGKYGHYTFGWVDWYYRFAYDATGVLAPQFRFENAGTANASWIGNIPLYGGVTATIKPDTPNASPMRYEYIDMRNAAKDEYASSRFFTFALAVNHLISGIDAVRLTQKVNRLSISQATPQLNLYAAMSNGNITPMMGMKWEF